MARSHLDDLLGTISWIGGVALLLALLFLAWVYGCAQQQTQGRLTPPPIVISASGRSA